MKQRHIGLIMFILWVQAIPAGALTIHDFLDAAARHPNVAISELAVREGRLRLEAANAALYPKLDLFGKAEFYNSPTNLRPMPPTEVNVAEGDSLPFSREIARYGLSFKAPIYVAEIYRLREKMDLLSKKSGIARQLNLVSRQAAVVSLNSAYNYLVRLDEAVDARLKSLSKTREDLDVKVKTGRTPQSESMKIDNSIITLEEQKNDLTDKMLNVRRDIEKFTGIALAAPVGMDMARAPGGEELIGIKLQEMELAAREKELARVKARRLPSVSLYGAVSGNDGTAYNTDDHIFRAYNFAGIDISMPLFDKSLASDVNIARVQLQIEEEKLADTRIELAALEKNLAARLPVVERSRQLAEKSAENNKKLLEIAKFSYDSGRTTTEEYLRYEAQLFGAQADLAKASDARWQIISKQAVLYGTDLRGVVK